MKPADKKRQAIIANVAKALREARMRQGLSMSAVAEHAGISQQMVSYIERQMRVPTLDTLIRVTVALDLDLAEIIRNAM